MSSFRLRPCFTHVIGLDLETARERIVNGARANADRCEVRNFPGFVSLHVLEKDSHYWSLWLSLGLQAEGEGQTRVRGIYGPNTNVWSAFLYGYMLAGSVGLFSGMHGACQAWLGMQAWGLWICGGMVAIMIGMYLFAQFGQKIGAQQTFMLHQIYEAAVGESVEIG